jgi:hypothetical protein
METVNDQLEEETEAEKDFAQVATSIVFTATAEVIPGGES